VKGENIQKKVEIPGAGDSKIKEGEKKEREGGSGAGRINENLAKISGTDLLYRNRGGGYFQQGKTVQSQKSEGGRGPEAQMVCTHILKHFKVVELLEENGKRRYRPPTTIWRRRYQKKFGSERNNNTSFLVGGEIPL